VVTAVVGRRVPAGLVLRGDPIAGLQTYVIVNRTVCRSSIQACAGTLRCADSAYAGAEAQKGCLGKKNNEE
jgi:hypothetical protein